MAWTSTASPRQNVRVYTNDALDAETFSDLAATDGAKAIYISVNRASAQVHTPMWDTSNQRWAHASDFGAAAVGNTTNRKLSISALGTDPSQTNWGVISGDQIPVGGISVYNGQTNAANTLVVQIIVIF